MRNKSIAKFEKKSSEVSVKGSEASLQKPSGFSPPQVREVTPVPAVQQPNETGLITVYKDLNQPAVEFALAQRKNMLIAVVIFFVLGIGILIGQKYNAGKRGVAAASPELQQMVPAGTESINSHYHYDKTCYVGKDGEKVCMTKTSQR